MAINYEPVVWDTTKHFNPTNMNHMDEGIKEACDKADANEAAIADVNSNLNSLIKTDTATVTTDASGNAILPLSREKILVSVDCTSHNGVRCMTMTANNNWYVFPLANSLTFSPYANQSMTFKYYYV